MRNSDLLRLVIVVIVLVVFSFLYQRGMLEVPDSWFEEPVEDRHAEAEIECAALTMLVDTLAEPSPRSNIVDERVVRTILNYAKVHETDLCKIFRQQLTLIPIGMSRKNVPDRRDWYVKTFEVGSDAIDAAIVLVKRVLSRPNPTWRATHYIRASRDGTLGNQTAEEIEKIRSTMVAVPKTKKATEGIIEFFEPKP